MIVLAEKETSTQHVFKSNRQTFEHNNIEIQTCISTLTSSIISTPSPVGQVCSAATYIDDHKHPIMDDRSAVLLSF